MNSGKTTTAAKLVKALLRRGVRVAACKLTGSVCQRDRGEFSATGAHFARDFSDYGFPSTYLATREELLALFETMLADAAPAQPDITVLEIADGVLQRETELLLGHDAVRRRVGGVLLTAPAPRPPCSGSRGSRAQGHAVVAVSGRITNSPLFVREFAASSPVRRRLVRGRRRRAGRVGDASLPDRLMSRSPLRLELAFLARHKALFATTLFWRGVWELAPMQVPLLAGVIVDGLTGKGLRLFGLEWPDVPPQEVLRLAALGLLAVAVLYGLSAYAYTVTGARLDKRFVLELRKAVVEKVMFLSLDHHQRYGPGALQERALLRHRPAAGLHRTRLHADDHQRGAGRLPHRHAVRHPPAARPDRAGGGAAAVAGHVVPPQAAARGDPQEPGRATPTSPPPCRRTSTASRRSRG